MGNAAVGVASVKKELRELILHSSWDSQARGRIAELQVCAPHHHTRLLARCSALRGLMTFEQHVFKQVWLLLEASYVQVSIEREGEDIDFEKLQGLWKLLYTTALDVVRVELPLPALQGAAVCMEASIDLSIAACRRHSWPT
jgi:hypothetical protein